MKLTKLRTLALGLGITAMILAAALPRNGVVTGGPGTRAVEDTLTSAIVTTAPTLDGLGTDAVWNSATAITVTVSGGANTVGNVVVNLKSVYVAGDSMYIWANWADAQDSKDRHPWYYNTTTGNWTQKGDTTSGDADSFYEDKLAMIWDIGGSIANFATSGPTVTCHSGLHYTNGAAELADMWHWKRVRTAPVGQVDDQYMDNDQVSAEGGRKSDPKLSGGYSNNVKTLNYTDVPAKSTSVPAVWNPTATSTSDAYYWIKNSDIGVSARNITQVWESNGTLMDEAGNFLVPDGTEHVPGIKISPITGDRGNISSGAVWAGGSWTLEMGRRLVTGSQYDVQFNSTGPSATYYFGLSTFNNAQIDHNAHFGSVYELVFQQPNQAPTDPVATFTPPTPKVGDTVTFGVVSIDPDGDALTYTWQFGDSSTGTGMIPTHVYTTAGIFTATVTVDDGHGHTKSTTVSVTVAEKPAGLSTTMLIIIIVVILLLVVVIAAVAMRRRKKSAPPMEPQQPLP